MNWLRGPAIGLVAVAVGAGVGCTHGEAGPGSDEVAYRATVAALSRVDSCEALLNEIQGDSLRKLRDRADALRDPELLARLTDVATRPGGPIAVGNFGGGVPGGIGVGAAPSPPTDAPAPAAPGAGTGQAGQPTSGADPSRAPSSFTGTNTQVKDVDEADIVKFDEAGERLFVLHGSELQVLSAWPATDMQPLTSASIEGGPTEMFVVGDKQAGTKILVFSQVYDDGSFSKGGGGEPGATRPAVPGFCVGCRGGGVYTKLSLLELSNAKLETKRELYFEGSYLSSRRHDTRVRGIVRGGFRAPGFLEPHLTLHDAWGRVYSTERILEQVDAWQTRVEQDIVSTELSDWLPREFERGADGKMQALAPRCNRYYAPSPGLTGYGITNVVAFDLEQPSAEPGGALVLGNASEVYSNREVMLLAQRDWRRSEFWVAGVRAQMPRTAIHVFRLDADQTGYESSGFVDGEIRNQFNLDAILDVDAQVVVRVATTERRQTHPAAEVGTPEWWQSTTINRVSALRQSEPGELAVIGQTKGLAEGEVVTAARFIGDIAYVVTAVEQRDPLHVIDMSDPTSPNLLGEVHISGFSQYVHPLGDDHLLTIGREGDTMTNRDLGLKLQIFDVSNPLQPKVAHEHLFAVQGTSEASRTHKAFTYYQERKLLAFPFVSYEGGFSSTLELFRVETDKGFTALGSIDHAELMERSCPEVRQRRFWACGYQPEVRRGLFASDDSMNDFVYSISYGGVRVHNLSDLSAAVAEVAFPAPKLQGPVGGWGWAPPGIPAEPPPVDAVPGAAPNPGSEPPPAATPPSGPPAGGGSGMSGSGM